MLPIIYYVAPYGKKIVIAIENISDDDCKFFKENKLSVSMEQISNGNKVLYSTTGKFCEISGEAIEKTYIIPENEACEVSFSKLRQLVEKDLK